MLKKYWNRPITWGNYAILAAISAAFSIIIGTGYYLKFAWNWDMWPFDKGGNKEESKEDHCEGRYIKV